MASRKSKKQTTKPATRRTTHRRRENAVDKHVLEAESARQACLDICAQLKRLRVGRFGPLRVSAVALAPVLLLHLDTAVRRRAEAIRAETPTSSDPEEQLRQWSMAEKLAWTHLPQADIRYMLADAGLFLVEALDREPRAQPEGGSRQAAIRDALTGLCDVVHLVARDALAPEIDETPPKVSTLPEALVWKGASNAHDLAFAVAEYALGVVTAGRTGPVYPPEVLPYRQALRGLLERECRGEAPVLLQTSGKTARLRTNSGKLCAIPRAILATTNEASFKKVAQIAEATGKARETISRCLSALVSAGFIERDTDGKLVRRTSSGTRALREP